MKRFNYLIYVQALVLIVTFSFTSCKKDKDDGPAVLSYVGSEQCQECHSDIYNTFIKSGHPYKLNKVIDNTQPSIPYSTDAGLVIPTPAGYDWSDITYMIGGYGWKARFLDSDGYIITKNSDTQYNLEDGSQVAYHADDAIGTKKYDCGKCHTTGWKHVDDGGIPQDGLPGMAGEFFAGGVHCEQCHGMGSDHISSQLAADINVDETDELCGQCHTRNTDRSIAASGGFIKHHEQYDEWLTSGHKTADIGCNTCHDPHASVVNDDVAPGQGVTRTCLTCHSSIAESTRTHNGADCITCHMPKASKSAIKTGDYTGDIRTHIFTINPASDGTLFNAAGDIANPTGDGVSLDYACYQCHQDDLGAGGTAPQLTMEQLSAEATNYHTVK